AAARLAFALGEVFLAHVRGVRRGGLALEHGVGGGAAVQLHGADGVVVARDGVVDQGRVVVGVDHGDHRDAELLGFLDRDVLMADVDHEQRVGQAVEVLQAAQRGQQLLALAAQAQHFVLDQLLEGAVGFGRFQFLQARDRLLDGAEVGQRAAQPALGHVRHAAALGFFLDRVARAALGADEQDDAALLGDARDEVHRVVEQRNRLLEVDDVDLAAGAEDVRGHLRVPVARLVAEVDAGFQHLAHGDLGSALLSRWGIRRPEGWWAVAGLAAGRGFRGWASPSASMAELPRGSTPAWAVADGCVFGGDARRGRPGGPGARVSRGIVAGSATWGQPQGVRRAGPGPAGDRNGR